MSTFRLAPARRFALLASLSAPLRSSFAFFRLLHEVMTEALVEERKARKKYPWLGT